MPTTYDHEALAQFRADGLSWGQIALFCGGDEKRLRQAHARWQARHDHAHAAPTPTPTPHWEGDDIQISTKVPGSKFRNVRSIDDLVAFFDVNLSEWEVVSLKIGGSEWDQSVREGTTASSVRIDASFKRIKFTATDATSIWADILLDATAYMPRVQRPEVRPPAADDPCLAEIAIHDPHFGLLVHGREVGGANMDLKIITEEYAAAVEHLIAVSRMYPVERYLYIVGHDLQHVNSYSPGGKTGVTRSGTPQDVDGRISKIFTQIRRSVVAGADIAATVAPVDIVVVPGNHDPDESYRMGEVLSAWYRNTEVVNVEYGPNKRKFYGYGGNAFMLTHGEELRRQRDNLPMVMATECPTDLWVASDGGCREVHTGHNHIRLQGGYHPTSEVSETRAIVTRSLPGLTATDAWHHEQGYKHRRAATLLIYRRSGGLVGLHEFNL